MTVRETLRRSPARLAMAIVVGVLGAGCSRAAGSVDESATPDPSPAISPSQFAVLPSPSPVSTPVASEQVEPAIPQPPDATLAVDGGDPVVGELGSYTWDGSGSDSPWLPGNPMRIGAGEELSLTLGQPLKLSNWTVSRSPASGPGFDIQGLAEGSAGPVRFGAPPPGTWSVNVNVWFVDRGSAAYYWLIDVE